MASPPSQPRRVTIGVIVTTIVVFGALLTVLMAQLRDRLRTEVLRREAEAIHAVALMELGPAEASVAQFGGAEFAIDDMFAAVLKSSRLRGVLGVQLFDATGRLREAKPLAPDDVDASKWWEATLNQPAVRFVADGTLDLVSPLLALENPTRGGLPLVEVVVPLQRRSGPGGMLGIARYWIDGATVAAEFQRMDRSLVRQAAIVFAGGAVIVGLVLGWAFARLAEANRRLQEQSADLARANEELDFAAKTGALGAISAHLIHGLKNPLAGIEGFVFETVIGSADAMRGEACRTAIETTRRLRALVAEVTTVLKDEKEGAGEYPVPVIEVLEAARVRAMAAAEQAGVLLTAAADPRLFVRARVANLAGLVLSNLVANAIEASSEGASVSFEAAQVDATIEILIRDSGSGIPPAVQAELFRPVRSTKRGGGGMGLAISMRLAKHAGGTLDVLRSDADGTVFRLTVPAAAQA